MATELTHFLSSNCVGMVFHKEAVIDGEQDLGGAAERALSADYVLLLLSPDSLPRKWSRENWEPILVEEARKFRTQIVYVLLHPCEIPRVFRLNTFFDLSERRLAGQRALKRWLLQQTLDSQISIELPNAGGCVAAAADALDQLECELADRPGVQTDIDREIALTFAHSHRDDFQAVLWLDCANRSRAGVLGDIACALGLRLRGTLDQNAEALHELCASRRILLVFENLTQVDREVVRWEGRASILFVSGQTNGSARSVRETAAIFANWRNDSDACSKVLGDAQYHLRKLPEYTGEEWQAALSLGTLTYSMLAHSGRLAEAHELLELLAEIARARSDSLTAARWDWENSWIMEEWGAPTLPGVTPPNQPQQLSLAFGA